MLRTLNPTQMCTSLRGHDADLGVLARLGAEELLEHAEEASRHPEMWVRLSTVESLGILGSEKGLPLILERLTDEEPAVRRSAVVAALEIGSMRARDALVRASRDEDWEVRLYAAEALDRLLE